MKVEKSENDEKSEKSEKYEKNGEISEISDTSLVFSKPGTITDFFSFVNFSLNFVLIFYISFQTKVIH